MPDVNEIYQSQFLRAEQLGGRAQRVTIEAAPAEIIGQGEKAQQKIVLRFKGCKPRLPLNKVNVMMCKSLFGPISENWIGKQIELRPEQVLFAGSMVPAIRVYPATSRSPPPPAPPAPQQPPPITPRPAAPAAAAPPPDAGDAWEPEAAVGNGDIADDLPWRAQA